MEFDLPYLTGFMDTNPYPGRHDNCNHKECGTEEKESHTGWCRHWVVLQYKVSNRNWDTRTWRENLKAVLPRVTFTFTGVEWLPGEIGDCWSYMLHLRVHPKLHRVDKDMLCQLERVGQGDPAVQCCTVQIVPYCCSMQRRSGMYYCNLYTGCYGHYDSFSGPMGPRSLFGDEYTRLLLRQVWRYVNARRA